MRARRWAVAGGVRAGAVEGVVVVERRAAGADDDGASSSSASSPAGLARRAGEPVGRGVELAAVLVAHRPLCEPGTNEIVPASAEVSSRAIQQVIISDGSR